MRALLLSQKITHSTTCPTPGVERTMCAKSQQSGDAIPRTSASARVTTHLSLGKSRRVVPSGPVAAGEGFERIRPEGGRPGRPAIFAEPWMANRKSPGEARPGCGTGRSARCARIRCTAAERPFLDGSPQAWTRGGYPPALARGVQLYRCTALPLRWLFAHIVRSYDTNTRTNERKNPPRWAGFSCH